MKKGTWQVQVQTNVQYSIYRGGSLDLNSSFWYNHHQWTMMVRDIKIRNPDEATKQWNKIPNDVKVLSS